MGKLVFKLKSPADFKKGNTYSICLRGARDITVNDSMGILPYDSKDEFGFDAIAAWSVRRKHFRFSDLRDGHCQNNYNPKARTYLDLKLAMSEAYPDFELNEIVTILEFIV